MALVLLFDKWDDFGYATLFSARLFFRGKMLFLGNVRLYYEGQSASWRFIEKYPPRKDTPDLIPLPRDHRYIALGSNLDFYKRLVRYAGHTRAREVLLDLHDVAILRAERPDSPDLRLINDDAYKTSLVRDRPEVEQVLQSAQSIVLGVPRRDDKLRFKLHMRLQGFRRDHVVEFDFTQQMLPGNINVLIGVNGSGKTQTLLHLIDYLFELDRYKKRTSKAKVTLTPRPSFKKVIALSLSPYSALPKESDVEDAKGTTTYSRISYFSESGRFSLVALERRTMNWLRSIVGDEVRDSGDDLRLRVPRLLSILESLEIDELLVRYSHEEIAMTETLTSPPSREFYRALRREDATLRFQRGERRIRLSSGQQQIFYMAIGLLAELEDDSLVLLDEPELYLHPNVEIDFLQLLQDLLNSFDSYSVIATHSNTIVRELPKTAVRIFRSSNHVPSVDEPDFQTFGADITEIANRVFDEVYADRPFERWLISRFGDLPFERIAREYGTVLNEESLALLFANSKRDEG